MINANLGQVIAKLFDSLNKKESEILRQRFGLENKEKKTLEAIGKGYGLSKERVRQIQNQCISKLKQLDKLDDLIKPIKAKVLEFFEQKKGVISEKFIFDKSKEPEALIFIMTNFFDKDLERIDSHPKFGTMWKIKHLAMDLLEVVLNESLDIIKGKQASIKKEELINLLKNSPIYKKYDLDEQHIISYLEASSEIEENILGEYGLAYWRKIVPKRIADKIYLVFKKENRHLHFTDITKKINEFNFDKKVAYPRAVHNELILDARFILIGRGTYALKEWGYEDGTVKDVLKKILQDKGEALSKEDLIKEVKKQRIAQDSTIYASLMDKNTFAKTADGKYKLAEIH